MSNVPPVGPETLQGVLAPVMTAFCLFGLRACLCLTEPDRLTQEEGEADGMRDWASINTTSVEAQGLSDPPVNLQGSCRGHQGGQRSAFMLITNNAVLCQQHKEEPATTGCSHESVCN